MAANTRTRKTRAKQSSPRKPKPSAATVDLRHPLPVRRRVFVGPMGVTEQAAIRAALAAASARLPIPVRAWNGPTARLADGTTLTHTPPHASTDQPPTFTAYVPCPHGATHQHPVTSADDLTAARAATRACTTPHGTPDQHEAITRGPAPTPAPKPPAVLQLREGIRRAEVARADNDTPREHPQP